jgi:hypothetical protein
MLHNLRLKSSLTKQKIEEFAVLDDRRGITQAPRASQGAVLVRTLFLCLRGEA